MADLSSPTSNHPNHIEGKLFFRRHPINLLLPSLISLGMLLGIWLALALLIGSDLLILDTYWPWVILLVGLALFFVLSYFLMQWIFWYFDIWIVTDEKFVDSQLLTFFLYSRAELPLRQVQDITYNTSGILATLFKCGDIIVQTASKQGAFKLLSIYQPQQAVQHIQDLVQQAAQDLYGGHRSVYFPVTVKLGELLVSKNIITSSDVAAALEEQAVSHEKLGRILLRRGLITKTDLLGALSAQYHLPQVDLTYYQIDPLVVGCLAPDLARKYQIVPVYKTPSGVVEVAVANLSEELVREVTSACGFPVAFMIADEDAILALIQKFYPSTTPNN